MSPAGRARRSAPRLAPLHRLAIAQAVSMAGDRVHHLALIALVSARTAAAGVAPEGWLLALGAAVFLPGFLLAPFLGPRLDAIAPSRVMAAVDSGRAAIVFGLPFLLLRAPLPVALVVLAGFFALNALFLPARGALPPQLVPRRGLASANALLVASAVVATLLATALGGLLVDAAGWAVALQLDAVTYLASAFLLWSLTSTAAERPRVEPRRGTLAQGARWVVRSRAARAACLLWCLLWGVGGVLQVAGISRVVAEPGRVGGLGLLAAVAAAGGLLGALLARRWRTRSLRWTGAGGGGTMACALAVLAGTGNELAWGAALFALGAAGAVVATGSETALQRSAPAGIRATAFGLREAAGRAAFLAGGGVSWAVAAWAGVPAALAAGGLAALLYGVVSLLPRAAARTAWRWRPGPAITDSAA